MKNGWTGGQYSLFRVLLGAYLAVHLASLLPWGTEVFSSRGVLPDAHSSPLNGLFPSVLSVADAPAVVAALLAAGVAAALALAAGWRDRWAAVLVWYVLACLHVRNPLIANPSMPYVGLVLLVHACLPRAPFLSVDARGRVDPGGGWRLTPSLFAVVWIALALGYTYSGWTKLASPSWVDGTTLARVLENPLARPAGPAAWMRALPDGVLRVLTWGALGLELVFAPLALFRRARPWIWGALIAMHLGILATIDFADLTLAMVVVHAFAFDPAWVRPRHAERCDTVFYDGTCGLCHGFVRLVLAEDTRGDAAPRFRFAPLQGDEFARRVPPDRAAGLPDSVVVDAPEGLLVRSDAAVYVLLRLGGLWGLAGRALRLLPRGVRDRGYDAVARVRRSLFAAPAEACPLMPPELGSRFSG